MPSVPQLFCTIQPPVVEPLAEAIGWVSSQPMIVTEWSEYPVAICGFTYCTLTVGELEAPGASIENAR